MLFDVKIPMLGFESFSQFELQKIDDNFMRLAVPGAREPSFTLINPFILREYSFDIPASVQALLQITEETNLLVYNVVVIQKPIEASKINFAAPLLFNVDRQTMAQLIVSEPAFGIAEPISDYLKRDGDA